MDLVEAYRAVKKSVVAVISKYTRSQTKEPPDFPQILGTGFVVADGLIATNNHVIRAAKEIKIPEGEPEERCPILVLYLHEVPGEGVAHMTFSVVGAFTSGPVKVDGFYYGPERFDLGFLHIKVRGLPCLNVSSSTFRLVEGVRVATAGFPMGTDALRAPGYVHQVTPTVQEGIVSAVLPFACDAPHAFMVNIMSMGGASGSPVFPVDEPTAVGVLYGGLQDIGLTLNKDAYRLPTNLSYVVPGHVLAKSLDAILRSDQARPEEDALALESILGRAVFVDSKEKGASPGVGKVVSQELIEKVMRPIDTQDA